MTAKRAMAARSGVLLDFGGGLNLNTGLPWRAARSAVPPPTGEVRDERAAGALTGAGCSVVAPMQSLEQNVPCDASRRQSAQTGLAQRSQLATAGVSEWFWHWVPMERHLVPSETMGMGSSPEAGGRFMPSDSDDGEGASSKMDSIFWDPPLPTVAASTNLGTSRPSTKAAWHSLEQNVPSFSSTTHMRQIDLSQALHVASAIDSGWLAQLLSIPIP